MSAVIPDHATWVRFPRFIGDAAMQLPVLRLLREIGVGPIVVWGPKLTVGLVEGHLVLRCGPAGGRENPVPSPWPGS